MTPTPTNIQSKAALISPFLKFWFLLSALIVFYDAAFVLNRPQTQKGGSLYAYFSMYDLYVTFDTLYADLNDPFVIIQSWLNIVEGSLLIFVVLLSWSFKCTKVQMWAAIIATLTSTMVFWKTVIFVMYDLPWVTEEVRNFAPQAIMCYYLTNSCWLVLPLWAMFSIPSRIIDQLSTTSQGIKNKVK